MLWREQRLVPYLLAACLLTACGETPTSQGDQGIVAASITALQRDSSRGAQLTHKKCASCHNLDRHLRKVGPSLKGVYGRAPSISGVPFAKWDEQSLDRWLADPLAVKPDTTMAIPGIQDAQQRQDIIAYLKQL